MKYDANILYGRSILVSVWEKQKKTFEPNVPIGATEINVNQLELHKLTIRWYRLKSYVPVSTISTAITVTATATTTATTTATAATTTTTTTATIIATTATTINTTTLVNV